VENDFFNGIGQRPSWRFVVGTAALPQVPDIPKERLGGWLGPCVDPPALGRISKEFRPEATAGAFACGVYSGRLLLRRQCQLEAMQQRALDRLSGKAEL
jgi:hypothetical protein